VTPVGNCCVPRTCEGALTIRVQKVEKVTDNVTQDANGRKYRKKLHTQAVSALPRKAAALGIGLAATRVGHSRSTDMVAQDPDVGRLKAYHVLVDRRVGLMYAAKIHSVPCVQNRGHGVMRQ